MKINGLMLGITLAFLNLNDREIQAFYNISQQTSLLNCKKSIKIAWIRKSKVKEKAYQTLTKL